jgi:hypothetical protein
MFFMILTWAQAVSFHTGSLWRYLSWIQDFAWKIQKHSQLCSLTYMWDYNKQKQRTIFHTKKKSSSQYTLFGSLSKYALKA